jgi:signal transduction histidine kinase
MRWWLALVFAVLATVTALVVAQVMTWRSEQAFRERARELAAGTAVTAAANITNAAPTNGIPTATAAAARESGIAIFVFDANGQLLSSPSSHGVSIESLGKLDDAVAVALDRRRLVETEGDGRRITLALPLRVEEARALVAVASRPDLVAAGSIVRGQILRTVVIAALVGGIAGTLVAFLITSRLRRVGAAAARIEQGDFDMPLEPMFPDELGQLAVVVDRMRVRLRESFAEIQSERDRLQQLLEQLQEGVVAVNRELQIDFMNSRAALILGKRRSDDSALLPEPWSDVSLAAIARGLFAPDARVANVRVAPDPEHAYLVVGIPVAANADTALLVITDITNSERRERAEREFVANAAHELRTPLAAISGAVDVLQAGAKEDPAQRDRFITMIDRQSSRLARLVRALLTLARVQTRSEQLTLAPVDIGALLAEIAEEYNGGDARLEVRCEPGLTSRSHHDLLAQAIENLIANAVKYGGEAPIIASAHTENGRLRIEVTDGGPGFSARDRDRVFDRFFRSGQRDANGFGLGLPIASAVAEALDGEIELENGRSGGATAAIVIPYLREGV